MGINESNHVLFRASLSDNLPAGQGEEGLFYSDGNTTVQVATTVGNNLLGFGTRTTSVANIGSVRIGGAINDSGDVAYRATREDGSRAVYLFHAATGTTTLIADSTEGGWDDVLAVSLNNNGVVAFQAVKNTTYTVSATEQIPDAEYGLYVWNGRGVNKVLATGDQVGGEAIGPVRVINGPGQVNFSRPLAIGFGDAALNDNDQLSISLQFAKTFPTPGSQAVTQGVFLANLQGASSVSALQPDRVDLNPQGQTVHEFDEVFDGAWVDPTGSTAYAYAATGGLINQILDVGPLSSDPLQVVVDGNVVATVAPGGSVDFVALLGAGVGGFNLVGTNPADEVTLQLGLSTTEVDLTVTSIPEPASLGLLSVAAVFVGRRRRR
jgi:hypothetical protein